MGAAVTEGITVGVSKRQDRVVGLVSSDFGGGDVVERPLDNITPVDGDASWTNYTLGVTKVMIDAGMQIDGGGSGFNLAVTSTLPAGAGMSSSAAFELATAYALSALFGFESADKATLARIGKQAETTLWACHAAFSIRALRPSVRPTPLFESIVPRKLSPPMPCRATRFWIFNSNKQHALVDSAYAERHKECHDALAVLQQTDISQRQLHACEAQLGDLLHRRASHIVGENDRVRAVEAALARNDLKAVGDALCASHESSRLNFENSVPELDFLVEAVTQRPNAFGARLTGGGFGGAVMAFTNADFSRGDAEAVAAAYKAKFGLDATVIHTCAGDGAKHI